MSRRVSFLDRRALFSSAAAAALLAASGVSAAGAPKRGGRLRMALSGAARSDTWIDGDGLFMQVARQGMVFDTLTEVAADGTLHPELATGWQSSQDARHWVFDLREGVGFHDGAPLTAQDVAFSLAALIGGDVTASGAHQIEIRLDAPTPDLPLTLAHHDYVIRPKHASEAGIGTGLYQVKRFAPGQHLLTTRVARHFKDGRSGWFDEVELTSIPSEPVRGQALGEYLVDAVDVSQADALTHLPDVTIMPDAHHPTQAVSHAVAQPSQISHLRPLDNLRAAERWWFG